MAAERTHLGKIVATGGIRFPGIGSGLVAVSDAGGNITWQAGAPTSGVAGGGLVGSYPNPQVLGFSDAWQPGILADRHGDLVVNSVSQVTVKAGIFWVLDATSILTRCSAAADTVLAGIPAAAASNFRLDQLVVDSTGVVSRLAGTQGTTVTLDNRTGAASIPAGSMLLWDLLVTSTGVTSANSWDRRTWAAQGGLVPVTTTLPVAITGRECKYLADAANGIVWTFKARKFNPDGTRNTSAFPWDYVGGPPLMTVVDASNVVGASAVYADVSGGPTLTLPLAGDWDCTIAANAFKTSGTGYVECSYRMSGGTTAAAQDTDSGAFVSAVSNTGSKINAGDLQRTRRKTGLAAATVLTFQGKTDDAVAANVRWRSLEARPVRVG